MFVEGVIGLCPRLHGEQGKAERGCHSGFVQLAVGYVGSQPSDVHHAVQGVEGSVGCSAEPPAEQSEDASQGESPASGQGQTAGDGSAGGSSASGPDFEYTVTTADGSSFSYQTDHPDYKSGSAQNGTATFLLRNGQKALISQMTDGLIHIVQKAHEAYNAAAAALLNKSTAENVSIPEHDENATETAVDVNCVPGAPTPYIRFTNTERKKTPEEEEKPNPETDKADPEKETEPPQTKESEKETEPPQTEEPVKETEQPQTEAPVEPKIRVMATQ